MKGTCACAKVNWIKPYARVVRHFQDFGPEICPDCETFISWEEEE